MNTRPFQYLCVHGHFYQPPRGNPVTGDIGEEPTAGKYRNWNERITAESYRPNADIGNFDRISFDVGDTLLIWLRKRAPETYRRIIQADKLNQQQKKVGNALGGTFHHVLLPLLKPRDKQFQLHWGRVAFTQHFEREPQGLWLPEMAVDLETLQLVEAAGYRFTIVAHGQTIGVADGSGPYWVDLKNGRKIAVFVRNDELSNDLSFNISTVGGAGHWARNKLGGRRARLLTLLAVGGETFGHHHLGEERFLHWLLAHEASAVGYRVVTLSEFFRDFPPREEIEIKEFSTWTSFQGIARWFSNNANVEGFSGWKNFLLRALDNLASSLDEAYVEAVRPLNVDPWRLRNEYVNVWLEKMTGPAFLAQYAPGLASAAEQCILDLLHAQVLMAKSYTSNAFSHDDFSHPESRYSIAVAMRAAHMAGRAVGEPFAERFRRDLMLVQSSATSLTGAQIYDEAFAAYLAPPPEEPAAPSTDSASDQSAAASTQEIQVLPQPDGS